MYRTRKLAGTLYKARTLRGSAPPHIQLVTAVLYGIQHSSDYKLQYTAPTIHTIIITRSISQSVFSINQTKPDITAKIIIVIIIAANNFTRSINLYRLRNKLFHLHYHKILAQVSFICFSIHYISYSFQLHYHMFRNVSYRGVPY